MIIKEIVGIPSFSIQYVGKKITPSGFYKLEADPEYSLALYNIAYGKEMVKAQPESYGNIGVIQPTRISDNKRQFWMVHGTQNSARLQMLNANKDIFQQVANSLHSEYFKVDYTEREGYALIITKCRYNSIKKTIALTTAKSCELMASIV